VPAGSDDGGVGLDDPDEVFFGGGLREQGGDGLLPCAVNGPLPQAVVI
jgi:hypothetical protein